MPAKTKGQAEDIATIREWQNDRGWVIQLFTHPNRSSAIMVRHGQLGYADHCIYKVYDYWEQTKATKDAELLAALGECEEVFHARAA